MGYLFIPFFNFYWAFVSFPKLAEGVNAWRAENGRSPDQRLKVFGLLYAINFLLYWVFGWDTDWTVTSNAVVGFSIILFDSLTFLFFYHLVVRHLESEQASLGAPIKRSVRVAALMALFFGALSVWIPIFLYWSKSWTASWLTTQASGALLAGSAIAGVLAVLLTLFAKRNQRFVVGSINLSICLVLPFLSFLMWMCVLVLNLVSKPSSGGGQMSIVGTSKDAYGRAYEARGGSRAMADYDGDAAIFHIDSDVLRFEKKTLQLNGYKVASLPAGIDKIVIEKKGGLLKILADSKLLLSWSKSASGQTKLEVSANYSLVDSESAGGQFGKLLRVLVAENRTQPITLNQKLVEDRLFAVIGTGMEEMIEQQLMLHGGSEEAVRELRSQFEGEIRKNFALEWGRIQSEFLPTEEEATDLLKDGPNRKKNSEAIEANWKKLEKSNVAIPFIATYLYQKFSSEPDHDPWFLESVKRVTEVMLREVEENAAQTQSQPLRFVPEEGDKNRSSWTVLPKGSALHPEGWSVMARLVIDGVAQPTLPGDKEPFLLLRLLDGNEDWIKLEIRDLAEDRKLTMSLKLGEPGSIFINGRGYRVLFPRQDIANDKKGTTPFATVLITEENVMAEEGEETSFKPEDLEGNLAQFYGTVGNVSISLEEAIITQASKARQGYATLPDPKSKKIPKEYWGEAIARLKPIRVMADRSNVFIVLKEEEGTDHGLYVYNSSSSYFPTLDEPRFLELRKMGSSEALWGSIFQCAMKTSVDE